MSPLANTSNLSERRVKGILIDVYIRREDAERFVGRVGRDDRELASLLRIEELELEGDGRNYVSPVEHSLH